MTVCGYQIPSDEQNHVGCLSDSIVQELVPCEFCDRCPFHTETGSKRRTQQAAFRGAGDVVAAVASKVGAKKKKGCGCGSRQALLNRILPLGPRRKDQQWTVTVTAAPRSEQTLTPCVYSLRQAGWEPVVFAEPDTEVPDDVEVKVARQRLGVWHNWLRSARWALGTSAEYILTVQDDVVFHPDSREFAEQVLWPSERCGFLSMYTPKHYSLLRKQPRPVGVNRIRTRSLWGACALIWPRDVLRQVIEHRFARTWLGARPRSGAASVWQARREDPARVQNSDTAIGKILNAMEREMWFIDPSPCQHVAQRSTIGHGGNRGRRNCGRCADFGKPLREQVPAPATVFTVDSSSGGGSEDAYNAGVENVLRNNGRRSMAISEDLWRAIRDTVQPHHYTLEFGPGASTTAFDGAACHLSVEQDEETAAQYESAVWAPVVDGWYRWNPERCYDVVLVDGPWQGDRLAGLEVIQQAASPSCTIFVDDIHRPAERELAEQLGQRLRKRVNYSGRWARIGQ